MGARELHGAKGGSQSAPTQASDTLSSVTFAQILDLITRGPIYGPPTGVAAQSVYLNDVPLQNADGTNNFDIDGFDFRFGDVDQTYIPGFASSQQETTVNVELKAVTPWTVTVEDLTTDAIVITLGVQSLSETNSSSGDVNGYEVDYQIQLSIDGGAYSPVVNTSFSGKASSTYQRSHKIPLSGAHSQYQLRVVRTTPDTTSVYIQDTTIVVSYTLVIDAKLRYPWSALAALSINAVQFSSIPTRSYDLKGLIISVPSNYDPDTRTYTGTWDGTFKQAWTDNPAWIFYDLVTNPIYGLGNLVSPGQIDRYALYSIAQYCDVMVSDGAGGLEPRFTCNCYLSTRADAYKVIQDIASIFRGMAYWGAGMATATADMPSDPVYVYTAANVVDGKFQYAGSARKTRYTAAAVTWNDPSNGYKQVPEYVPDPDGIARYGLLEAQLTAFGCTSRGQAQRVGHWLLLTNRIETNTVTFSVGLDGTLCAPGQIIAVADANRVGYRMAGRLHAAVDTANVVLDKAMEQAAVGDVLTVVMPDGVAAKSTISAIDPTFTQIQVNPAFASVPNAGSVWMIESAAVESQLFRVVAIKEKQGITFEVTATQYEPAKYAAIDNGAVFTPRPTVGNRFTTQAPPTAVSVDQFIVTNQGISNTNLSISWAPADNAVSYRVQWQKDNGVWVDAGTTGQCSIDISGVYTGNYLARVSATNGMGITSVYAYSSQTSITGKTGAPPQPATLTASTTAAYEIDLAWTFPQGAGDTAYTEIRQSTTPSFANGSQLRTYSYPTNKANLLGLAAGTSLYFWARLVDTTGNVGAWFPSSSGAGVNGQSSSNAGQLLTYLTGQIGAQQLTQDMLTPIQSVPALSTSLSSATSSIASLSTSSATLSSSVAALNSSLSTANSNITANTSSITAEVSTRAAAITAEASTRQAAISSLSTTVQNNSTSVASQVSTLTANLSTTSAGLSTEQSARVAGDSANASAISTLTGTVNTNSTSASTAMSTEASTRASADAANASNIAALSTSFSSSLSTTNANLVSEQSARASADSANASSITALTATVNTKNSTFKQSTVPTASQVNDTWIDTGSTNVLLGSQDPTNAAWTAWASCSYTANAGTAPDGTQTATKVTRTVAEGSNTYVINGDHGANWYSNKTMCWSVYLMLGTYNGTFRLFVRDNPGTNYGSADFNLTNGMVSGLQYGATAGIVPVGGGWYRCWITAAFASNSGAGMQCIIDADDNGTGSSGDTYWLWGGQFENQAAPGRYIPTTTAPVSTAGNNNLLTWNGTAWALSQDAAIPAAQAAIGSEASTRAGADSALASQISTLSTSTSSSLSTASANLVTEQSTRASGDASNAATIAGLSTSVSSSLSTTNANLATEQSARASGDSANATALSALSTSFSKASNVQPNIVPNPAGASGTAGWSGPWAFSTFTDGAGTYFTASAQGSSSSPVTGSFGTATMPVNGGQAYTISGDLNVDTGAAGTFYFDVQWLDSNGNSLLDGSNAIMGTFDGAFHRVSTTDTAPSGAVKCYVRVVCQSAHWTLLKWRNVKLELGSSATPYSVDAAVTAVNSAVTSEATSRAAGDAANAASIATLSTSFSSSLSTTNANLTSEQSTRAAGDSANASSISALSTSMSTGLSTSAANLTAEQNARASADSAAVSQINTLQAQVGNALSLVVNVTGNSAANLPSGFTTGVFNAVSNAQIVSTGRSWNVATISASNQVTFVGTYDVFGNASNATAMANALNALTAGTTVLIWTRDEPQTNLAGTLTNALTGCGASAATLSAVQYRGAYMLLGAAGSPAGSGFERVAGTVASDTTAWFSQTLTLVNGKLSGGGAANTAAVQTVAQSLASLNGQLSASYWMKAQVSSNGQTYMAGIGLGVNASGSTVSSQVLVAASQFAVIDPNSAAANVSPFVIQNGQTYINQALIGNAWITNAMIGQTIQATANGANGNPLWVIDKTGGFTMNGANSGSGYSTMNSGGGQAYDANGTLRVRWGTW